MRIIALILIVLALLLSNATAMNPPPPQYNGDQTGESRAGGLPLFEVPLLEPMFHTPPPFQSGTNTEDTPPPRQPSPPPQDNSVELPDPNEHKKAKTSGKPSKGSNTKKAPPPPSSIGHTPSSKPQETVQTSHQEPDMKKQNVHNLSPEEKNMTIVEIFNHMFSLYGLEQTIQHLKSLEIFVSKKDNKIVQIHYDDSCQSWFRWARQARGCRLWFDEKTQKWIQISKVMNRFPEFKFFKDDETPSEARSMESFPRDIQNSMKYIVKPNDATEPHQDAVSSASLFDATEPHQDAVSSASLSDATQPRVFIMQKPDGIHLMFHFFKADAPYADTLLKLACQKCPLNQAIFQRCTELHKADPNSLFMTMTTGGSTTIDQSALMFIARACVSSVLTDPEIDAELKTQQQNDEGEPLWETKKTDKKDKKSVVVRTPLFNTPVELFVKFVPQIVNKLFALHQDVLSSQVVGKTPTCVVFSFEAKCKNNQGSPDDHTHTELLTKSNMSCLIFLGVASNEQDLVSSCYFHTPHFATPASWNLRNPSPKMKLAVQTALKMSSETKPTPNDIIRAMFSFHTEVAHGKKSSKEFFDSFPPSNSKTSEFEFEFEFEGYMVCVGGEAIKLKALEYIQSVRRSIGFVMGKKFLELENFGSIFSGHNIAKDLRNLYVPTYGDAQDGLLHAQDDYIIIRMVARNIADLFQLPCETMKENAIFPKLDEKIQKAITAIISKLDTTTVEGSNLMPGLIAKIENILGNSVEGTKALIDLFSKVLPHCDISEEVVLIWKNMVIDLNPLSPNFEDKLVEAMKLNTRGDNMRPLHMGFRYNSPWQRLITKLKEKK